MRKLSLLNLFTVGLLLAAGNNAALAQNQNKNTRKSDITRKSDAQDTRFEHKVNAINEAAKKKGQMDNVLGDICNNVNLNLEQVRALHRSHPNAGAGAILVAAVIGDQTKQPAEKFLESHLKGNTWDTIIARNNVSTDKLDQKLDKVQSAIDNSQTPAAGSASSEKQTRR